MTIAVDYDGTLEINKEMNLPLIANLRHRQKNGDVIILWTCRQGPRLNEAVSKLLQVGFRPNLVNENTSITVRTLGYNPRKILADVYIDDKNAR